MNRKMSEFIARECYDGAPFHHIHGAGRDYGWMQEEIGRRGLALEGTGIEVREYIYDMPLVMAAADVVLCPGSVTRPRGARNASLRKSLSRTAP